MMPAPEAAVAHRTTGRIRLVVPSKKRERGYFSSVETELRNIPEVKSVMTNPLTGSLVIQFRGKWRPIRERLESSALLKISLKRRRKGDAVRIAFDEIRKLDERVEKATDQELNLTTLVGLGLLGLSVVQIFRKQILPPASTLISEGLWILADYESKQRAEIALRTKRPIRSA